MRYRLRTLLIKAAKITLIIAMVITAGLLYLNVVIEAGKSDQPKPAASP